MPNTLFTAEGERALRDRLEALEREHQEDFVARLREARALGDPSANDDLLQIREEEAVLVLRIARLREQLDRATVVPDGEAFDGRVGIGTRVEVEDLDSGARTELLITDGQAQPMPDAVSAGSPIGQALIDTEPGATVTIDLPDGRTRRLQILAVHDPAPA